MTATSPGWSRLVRFFVRRSTRAGPTTPGPPSGAARRGIRSILTRRWSHGATGRRSTPGAAALPAGPPVARTRRRPLPHRRGQEFAGVGLSTAGVLHPPEHPGELADPPLVVQCRHTADGHLAVTGLDHREVTVRIRSDLGEVGDDEHLRAPGEPGQSAADAECRAAAHTGVDLVEDERRNRIGGAE